MEVVSEREAAAATSKAVSEVLSVAAGGSGPPLGLGGSGGAAHRGGGGHDEARGGGGR